MALSTRPRRSRRRMKKALPKKRKTNVAAGKPRKAAAKAAAKTASRTAAPGIVETALATFAHEVRTPLTGILAISDLLATSDLGERERRWVDTIKAGAEHLASLATLFVDAARRGRSGFGVRQDFFDLRTLAHSVGDSLAGRATAKGLQSRVEISDKLPTFVDRRSRPPAGGAGKPDRQRHQVHRTGRRSRWPCGRPARERQGRRGVCGFR